MVSVSNDYKTAMMAVTRDIGFGMIIQGTVGGVSTQYILDGNDIINAEADYPFSVNDMPTIGQVFSSTFKVTMKSDKIPSTFWQNATGIEITSVINVQIDPDDPASIESCQLGVFSVVSRTSTDNFATYVLEARDWATKLDVPLPTTWDTGASTGSFNPWTYYADTVVGNILSACGLSLEPGFTFPTDSQGNRLCILSLNGNWMPENITARQALGWIGGLWGANGMMNRYGQFTFKRWTATFPLTQIPLSMQHLGGLARDREDPQYEFGGFYHSGENITNPTSLVPTDSLGAVYLYSDPVIKDWTLVTPWTEITDTFVHYSNQFATDWSGKYFVGGELQYRGMPWLECGDVVTVVYPYNGVNYLSEYCIMNHTLIITGGLRGTMRCYTPYIAQVEDNGAASSAFSGAVNSGVNLGNTYPVGSVVITDSNTNPGDTLKFGTWTLIDKEFKSQSRTATVSRNTTNFSALSVTAIYEGHNITFVGEMTSSVSMGETNLEVLTQTLSDNGASSLPHTIPFVGYTDGGNAVIMIDIDTAGRVRTLDVVVRGTGTSVASGNSFDWSVTCPCLYTAMQDSFCDKFYWKRTA